MAGMCRRRHFDESAKMLGKIIVDLQFLKLIFCAPYSH